MNDTGSVSRSRDRVAKRLVAALLVTVFVAGWWMVLRPASLGGPLTMIVVNGESMEPGMHTGDLAVVYRRDSYARGDVVAFRHRNEDGELGSHVIHRIVGGNAERGFALQGDNNDWVDPWEPTGDQVAGEMLFHVAGFGRVVLWVSNPGHLAALLASLTVALVIAGGGSRSPKGARAVPAGVPVHRGSALGPASPGSLRPERSGAPR